MNFGFRLIRTCEKLVLLAIVLSATASLAVALKFAMSVWSKRKRTVRCIHGKDVWEYFMWFSRLFCAYRKVK